MTPAHGKRTTAPDILDASLNAKNPVCCHVRATAIKAAMIREPPVVKVTQVAAGFRACLM